MHGIIVTPFLFHLLNNEVDLICSRNSCSPKRLHHESMISTTECIRKDHELKVAE